MSYFVYLERVINRKTSNLKLLFSNLEFKIPLRRKNEKIFFKSTINNYNLCNEYKLSAS